MFCGCVKRSQLDSGVMTVGRGWRWSVNELVDPKSLRLEVQRGYGIHEKVKNECERFAMCIEYVWLMARHVCLRVMLKMKIKVRACGECVPYL